MHSYTILHNIAIQRFLMYSPTHTWQFGLSIVKTLVGGRVVVETKAIDHHLKYCAITSYAIVVVEWSKFSEN